MRVSRRSLLGVPVVLFGTTNASAAGSPRILVDKSARTLTLHEGDKLVFRFPIALGHHPQGTKSLRGDGATPEGDYVITHHNAKSQYHLSLGIDYPNVQDAKRGLLHRAISRAEYHAIVNAHAKGERPPQRTALGGDIFVHGGGNRPDWTLGCVALSNEDIEALFARVPKGTPVRIVP